MLPEGCIGCSFPFGVADCDDTSCSLAGCHEGSYDLNGIPGDGCEYQCSATGEETCNGLDDDCDGLPDEDFDLAQDPENCGECGKSCKFGPRSQPLCSGGLCSLLCDEGYFDNNGDPLDGCEGVECDPQEPRTETESWCNNRDDDCDGETDEGWNKTLPESCGLLCTDCTGLFPSAESLCTQGNCRMGACLNGAIDANTQPEDGCECMIQGQEVCNGEDDDCNGAVDDGLNCCPEDMVQVEHGDTCVSGASRRFCIDRYEASVWDQPDCTGGVYSNLKNLSCSMPGLFPDGFPADVGAGGAETTRLYACSLAGVYPTRCLTWYQANRACENVGKRLCSPEEWQAACQGPACTTYPYGDEFTWDTCNYLLTFAPTWSVLQTGEMEACLSGYGINDLSGNVWEYDSSGGGNARGGAYNCNEGAAPVLESCPNIQFFSDLVVDGVPIGSRNNVGFRCCR